ncbi:MAG TPA: 2-hydroxyacid dehydrogenase [Fodinibius sp.]|nr:2-hydroxyacid dehydrogenase [Fodinibius sp.]
MKILVTAPYSNQCKQELANTFEEIIYKPWKAHGRGYNAQELISMLNDTHAEALITEHDRVTKAVIQTHPGLRFIGVCRGTPSNVALDTANKLGIPVFNAPGRNAQAVAELFVANVITLLRKTIEGWQWLRNEEWEEGAHTAYLQFKGHELAGKTVGMVGFGAVARHIARIVKAFPADIQFYDPYVDNPEAKYEQKESLEELFATCDIVSVHLPVNEETTGMIDGPLLSRMASDAIFVNTARAAVVRREALLEVLENNDIRGAVLDVYNHEPPDETDYRLIHLPNVLATPHIAGATYEVEDHHSQIMNRTILRWWKEQN